MTTDRVYRKKLSIADAFHRLEVNAGSQFDPKVVQVFLGLVTTHPEFGQPSLEEAPSLEATESLQAQLPWLEEGLLRPA
jgi:HD-GYP domain-containing protein (c-di-GMP phosphodiesterase class II)